MIRKTEAAVLIETGKPLELWELGLPEPAPGQVLVEIAFSGVCHSQLNEVLGRRGPDRFLPHCLGHEGSGTVLEVGEGVTKVRPGQNVVMTWLKGNGSGPAGLTYTSARGPVNAGAITTFQRHALVSESRVVPVPSGLGLDVAALLGCALPTGAGIVFHSLRLQVGQNLAVMGAGGVGLSTVLAAVSLGASPIIVVDVLESKLEMARSFGATHTLLAGPQCVAEIHALTGGRGVDFAVEASGNVNAMENALSATRDGGLCIVAGNPPVGHKMSIDPYQLIRGKRLQGSWGGGSQPDVDIPRLAELILSGAMPADRLLTHRYSLEEVNLALQDLENGKVTRALLDMRLEHKHA